MYVLFTFVTLRKSSVHPLLNMASIYFIFRTKPRTMEWKYKAHSTNRNCIDESGKNRFEKIIRRHEHKMVVRGIGYPESFNSLIDNDNLTALRNNLFS